MLETNKKYSIEKMASIVGGHFIMKKYDDEFISHLLIDSRRLREPENTAFFALKTESGDGHKYINELFEKGVKNFVVSETSLIPPSLNAANIILVENVLSALQKLSKYHREHFQIPVTAITGSNGKTIVKEWLFQLLSPCKKIVRSPKSYNSQIGVPLSVWQINDADQMGIFEAGISEPNEMDVLKSIIKPDIGIFTNIGHAHDENFLNYSQKIGEKLKLFTDIKTLIYCADHKDIQEIIIKSGLLNKIDTFSWSRKKGEKLFVKNILKYKRNTLIEALYNNKVLKINIPFTDEASIENAIHCWCYMLFLGYKNDVIASRMSQLSTVAMRLELKEGINNCTIINDAYNADINALSIAIDLLKQQRQHTKKTLILSDILQSGLHESNLYEKVAALVSEKNIDRLIGIGKAVSRQAHLFNNNSIFFESTAAFIQSYPFSEFNDEAILLKGARNFEFEKIVAFLEQKTHTTVLEINLNAILHNLNYYKSKLAPETKLMAMVKAFSYGTGSFEIANMLQFARVDYLGVAFTDEGKALRKAGITLPIMVMSPDEAGFDDMIKYKLEPEIYSMRMLHMFLEALKRHAFASQYIIHIKLDTGMHRLGFAEEDLHELTEQLGISHEVISVGSVFTHLAASDLPQEDAFTHQQLEKYNAMCRILEKGIKQKFIKHVLNTAGIIRFPQYHYDMVRLGLGLYGVPSTTEEEKVLENVSTLRTNISQIKKVKANDTVGYKRSAKADSEMRIATVPVGYADGLSRALSNGKGKLYVNNQPALIFGNVCMDMCMIDISNIEAKEGDDVVVFDKKYPVTLLAKAMNTIPYEVLTAFSRRVKRVYYHE